MEEKNSILVFRQSLLDVVKITGNTIENLPRPMYLATCKKYGIDGWTKEQILESGKGWFMLKKEAMDFGESPGYDYSLSLINDEEDIDDETPIEVPFHIDSVLKDYSNFVKTYKYAPSLKMFKKFSKHMKSFRKNYGNMYDLDSDFRTYYPDEADKYLCDKRTWNSGKSEYKEEFFKEICKHNKFVFVSVGSLCPADYNFLASLRNYARLNDAMVIGLPMFKSSDKTMYDFCVDPKIKDYMWITFEDIRLNNNLVVQVLKTSCTTKSTLTGIDQLVAEYDSSIIVAGSNQQLQYIPVLKNKTPNMVASTGCCTEYKPHSKNDEPVVPTKAEKLAQKRISIKGGLIVDIINKEQFSVKNIEADEYGNFIDLGNEYRSDGSVVSVDGAAYIIGDLHVPEHNKELLNLNLQLIKDLNCTKVVLHDSVNMAYVSHHNADNAPYKAQLVEEGKANILGEVKQLAEVLESISQIPSVESIIIPHSNHPAHFDKFIQDLSRVEKDNINLRTSLLALLALLDNKIILKYMVEDIVGYKNDKVDWVKEDEGREIYGVQVGLHGSEKVNGGRLTPTSTNKAFSKTVLAHRHSAGIDGDTITVGIACEKEQGYNHGLSSWTESSAVIYPNGKVQLLTFVNVGGNYLSWL